MGVTGHTLGSGKQSPYLSPHFQGHLATELVERLNFEFHFHFALALVVLVGRFSMHTVFVYGTLKNGESNHYLLEEKGNGVCTYRGELPNLVVT